MNSQNAIMQAEEYTHSICLELDHDLKVEELTTLSAIQIISGDCTINDLEKLLSKAYVNGADEQDILKCKNSLKNAIDEMIKDYLETCDE